MKRAFSNGIVLCCISAMLTTLSYLDVFSSKNRIAIMGVALLLAFIGVAIMLRQFIKDHKK